MTYLIHDELASIYMYKVKGENMQLIQCFRHFSRVSPLLFVAKEPLPSSGKRKGERDISHVLGVALSSIMANHGCGPVRGGITRGYGPVRWGARQGRD